MLGDQARQEGAIDPSRDVVPRGDGEKGARVVVEADCVIKARGFGRLLPEAQHPLNRVMKPPGRPEL